MLTLLISRGLLGFLVCLFFLALLGITAVIHGSTIDHQRLEALKEHRRQQLRDMGEDPE